MSYQTHNNSQQQSAGFIVVIAFHALLIWALANGLVSVVTNTPSPSDTIEIKTIDLKHPEPPTVEPQEFTFNPTINITKIPQPLPPEITADPKTVSEPSETSGTNVGKGESQLIITKPGLKKISRPDYPTASKRLGEEGTTELRLFITSEGKVSEANIFSSSGSDRLDEAALRHAQRSWAFTPCTENGIAVACWFKTKLVWRLEDSAR
jgi:periplasmic protein TonB